jgi:alkylated DNA repair protein (DNA oxidative demethylase)
MTGSLLPRERWEVAPGAVLVPDWLGLDEQRALVEAFRGWAEPPAPLHATRLPRGGVMSVQTVCLGWHWIPYRYSRVAEDVDGAPVTPLPGWLGDLGRRAVAAVEGDAAGARYRPDVALVNLYADGARMGQHRDADERSPAPVVSLSIGDSCTFRFGNPETRGRPYVDVELRSGDLFVFGGPSRLAYHGVPRTARGSGDPATGLVPGERINVTLRETGLAHPEV